MDQHAGAIRTKEMVQALSNGLPTSTCHLFGCEQVADRARHSAPHDPGRADLHRDGHGEGCRAVRQQQQPRRPGFAGLTPPPAAVVIALGRRAFRAVPAADGYGHRPRRAELTLPRDDHRRHRDFPRGAPATGLASDKTRVLQGNRWIPAWTQPGSRGHEQPSVPMSVTLEVDLPGTAENTFRNIIIEYTPARQEHVLQPNVGFQAFYLMS